MLLAGDWGHEKRGVLNADQNRVKPAGDGKRPEEMVYRPSGNFTNSLLKGPKEIRRNHYQKDRNQGGVEARAPEKTTARIPNWSWTLKGIVASQFIYTSSDWFTLTSGKSMAGQFCRITCG